MYATCIPLQTRRQPLAVSRGAQPLDFGPPAREMPSRLGGFYPLSVSVPTRWPPAEVPPVGRGPTSLRLSGDHLTTKAGGTDFGRDDVAEAVPFPASENAPTSKDQTTS